MQLNIKIQKSAKELSKLNSKRIPSEQDVDQEVVTYEERECFRKIGLKMKSNLLLGKRKKAFLAIIFSYP